MVYTQISFVLTLEDAFHGRRITDGGALFSVDGRQAYPLRKPEGFFVFLGPPGPHTVTVNAPGCAPCTSVVEGPPGQVHVLRLLRSPTRTYPDSEWVKGTAPPGSAVALLVPENPPLLLKSAQPQSVLLAGYSTLRRSGQSCFLGKGKKGELVCLQEKQPDGSYLLLDPLRYKHAEGESVCRAWCGETDEQGVFSVAMPPGEKEKITQQMYYGKGVKRWECLPVPVPR